jgi:DmsE family decaheme c-type cytochrome
MALQIRKIGPISWFSCAFLIWSVAFVSARANSASGVPAGSAPENSAALRNLTQAPPPSPTAPQKPATSTEGSTYIGEKACVECHEGQRPGYYESKHHRATDARTPGAKNACETCHGPGSKHADDPQKFEIPRDFTKMKPADVATLCTTCHNRGEHALWDGSQHASRGVTCTNCHSMHAEKSETGQLKKATQKEVCAQCHQDKVAKIDRSGHMPVREGKLQCTTCHNTHGSTNVKLLRKGDSVSELCTSCHAEKRGPFLWEHAPARDGCTTCHDPHGSANDRMLVARTPMLCQRCHVSTRHPSTIYDAALINTSVRVYARSCVTCHAAIHGSNHPSGQRFIR